MSQKKLFRIRSSSMFCPRTPFEPHPRKNRNSLSESRYSPSEFGEAPHGTMKSKRAVFGVTPRPKFGPKASLKKLEDLQCHTDAFLKWDSKPENVLVIKKIHDTSLDSPFIELVNWLVVEKKLKIFLEVHIKEEVEIMNHPEIENISNNLFFFDGSKQPLEGLVDMVICAGGDGTLLYASSLFQRSVPPVMAFHLGSLGFLLPFDFKDFKYNIDQVLKGLDISIILRTRLIALMCQCTPDHLQPWSLDQMEQREHFLVLNEVVVDRGDTAYLCQLDLFIDDVLVTVVQGDGLIISTPTGSTAYSAAAGASMVHPNVPAIVITPICPHSLSFRPIVVPSGVQIKVMISPDARDGAWASFDGRQRQPLGKGRMLVIQTAAHPFPCVTSIDPVADWFCRLAGCLNWNVRKIQSSLNKNNNNTDDNSTDNEQPTKGIMNRNHKNYTSITEDDETYSDNSDNIYSEHYKNYKNNEDIEKISPNYMLKPVNLECCTLKKIVPVTNKNSNSKNNNNNNTSSKKNKNKHKSSSTTKNNNHNNHLVSETQSKEYKKEKNLKLFKRSSYLMKKSLKHQYHLSMTHPHHHYHYNYQSENRSRSISLSEDFKDIVKVEDENEFSNGNCSNSLFSPDKNKIKK